MFSAAVPRIDGAKIGVLLEHKFIADEIFSYLHGFPLLGAEVVLLSRLPPDGSGLVFYSDVDPLDSQPWQTPQPVRVEKDFSTTPVEEYDAIIMAANYTSVRLRYNGELPASGDDFDPRTYVASAPAVRFFAQAMANSQVVKGALCHGLWLLTPVPHLLKDRKVICHSVVMADVLNCGARVTLTPDRVVRDGDLVTGFSRHEVLPFMVAIAQGIAEVRGRAVIDAPPPQSAKGL